MKEKPPFTPGYDLVGVMGETAGANDAAIFDTGGQFLIPGLWDSHVHGFSSADESETAPPLYLINGITGIRDMGGSGP